MCHYGNAACFVATDEAHECIRPTAFTPTGRLACRRCRHATSSTVNDECLACAGTHPASWGHVAPFPPRPACEVEGCTLNDCPMCVYVSKLERRVFG